MEQVTGDVLVVGAGVAGIRAALDLAETGYQVLLTDTSPAIGGILGLWVPEGTSLDERH